MQHNIASGGRKIARRTMLAAAATIAAVPATAEECRVGPPPHHKGPLVFMDYDQVELDASYDQEVYEPLIGQVSKRFASNSEAVRARIGAPQRVAYGPTEIEKLDDDTVSAIRPKSACGSEALGSWGHVSGGQKATLPQPGMSALLPKPAVAHL
jgi:hypothetical protein